MAFPAQEFRKVKIIATIGKSSCQKEVLKDMIAAGMDGARLTDRFLDIDLLEVLCNIRDAAAEMKTPIGIMLSLRESAARVGSAQPKDQITLQEGETIYIGTKTEGFSEGHKVLKCDNKDFLKTVKVNDRLLIDFGKIIFTVIDIEEHAEEPFLRQRVNRSLSFQGLVEGTNRMKRTKKPKNPQKFDIVLVCRVFRNCTFTFEKPVIIERDGQTIDTCSEEKEMMDIKSLQWANEHEIDSVVHKQIFEEEGLEAMLDIHVHKAKHFVGIQFDHMLNLVDPLLNLVDGLVVCRGSLGQSSSYMDVCRIQKQLIAKCVAQGKLSIVSTQILDSMLHTPSPSSADITDLTDTVLDGCDAVLIMGATAYGDYPVEAVKVCSRTILEAEKYGQMMVVQPPPKPEASTIEIISYCAVSCSARINAKTIICVTHKTDTALIVSRNRPACPIVALTDSPKTVNHLKTVRGVYPVLYVEGMQRESILTRSIQIVKNLGFAQTGDIVVYVAGEDDTRITGDTCRFQICTV